MNEQVHLVPQPPVQRTAKIPPNSIEAEESLLGSLLLDHQKWDDVNSIVTVEDFYHIKHQTIFNAMIELVNTNNPVDVVTVSEKLTDQENFQKQGGIAYLSRLAENTPGVANLLTYAKIVRDNSILRALINGSNQILEHAYHPDGESTENVLNKAEKLILKISERHDSRRKEFRSIGHLVPDVINRIEELQQSSTGITGIPTGFIEIDRLTSGLQRGDLIVVAGRPSMGKTSLALNIAEYVGVKQTQPVGIFSLEMSGQQLTMRLLSSLSGVDSNRIRTGRLDDADWPRINIAVETLQSVPIVVDESSGLNVNELRSRSRMMQSNYGKMGLLVVDYLQLMHGVENVDNRATEISGITRNIKLLAQELDVPIVVLSQLNRSIETRTEKRPKLSDLRESGAIEQDADVIMFIHRDEVNDPGSDGKGTGEIIIGKQRNGPIDSVKLTYKSNLTRFQNYAPDDSF
ncbi:MAG: replicative DNA helicase [Gammaproteobacteria bacterium]|nr:replicative DNA helicase [Gammaproteobacteria bacterium]MCY4218630.1 replicative DNA helicase [Gammaproteobacteria bacterium]MCY4275265.1 replicative DNA helicase [Gammaproteobacteria bacterium]